MGTKEKPEEKVLSFIQKFDGSTAELIASTTGIFKLNVFKALKKLTDGGKVVLNNTTPKTYSVAGKEKSNKKEVVKKEIDEASLPKTGKRDTSKMKFLGKDYGKGQLVLAVIRTHIEKNPRVSLEKLKEQWPDTMQPRYGCVVEVSKARKLSVDRDRFFLNENQILKLKDKRVAVSNQWGQNNIKEFLKVAKSLGYNIK